MPALVECRFVSVKNASVEMKWRRGQDSNLHDLSVGGFQDRCTTNYATPPRLAQEL